MSARRVTGGGRTAVGSARAAAVSTASPTPRRSGACGRHTRKGGALGRARRSGRREADGGTRRAGAPADADLGGDYHHVGAEEHPGRAEAATQVERGAGCCPPPTRGWWWHVACVGGSAPCCRRGVGVVAPPRALPPPPPLTAPAPVLPLRGTRSSAYWRGAARRRGGFSGANRRRSAIGMPVTMPEKHPPGSLCTAAACRPPLAPPPWGPTGVLRTTKRRPDATPAYTLARQWRRRHYHRPSRRRRQRCSAATGVRRRRRPRPPPRTGGAVRNTGRADHGVATGTARGGYGASPKNDRIRTSSTASYSML